MNDAYTIGITLALENGVSAGIEEIRRDLQELNRTVDTSIGELIRLDTLIGATLRAVHQAAHESGLMQIAEAGQRLTARPLPIRVSPAPLRQVEPELSEQPATSVANGMPVVRNETTASPSVAARGEPVPLIMHSSPARLTLPPAAAPPPQPKTSLPLQLATSQPAAPTAQPQPIAPSRLMMSVNAPLPSKADVTTSAGYPPLLPIAAPAALPNTPRSTNTVSASPALTTFPPTGRTQTLQPADLAGLVRRLAPLSVEAPSDRPATPSSRGEGRVGDYAQSTVPVPSIGGLRQVEGSWTEPPYERPLTVAPFPTLRTPDSRRDLRDEVAITNVGIPQGPAAPTAMSAPGAKISMTPPFVASSTGPILSEQNQSAGSETGHVFLDGQLVGRWMREHLAQLAARPPSGSTGFDPKLSMMWPGAPIQA